MSLLSIKLPQLFRPYSLFFLAVCVRLLYLNYFGAPEGVDSGFYQENATILINAGYNPLALLAYKVPPYYWLYSMVIALLANNLYAVIGLQIFLAGLSSVLVYSIAKSVFSENAGILSGLFYVFLFELFQWDTYILTDSLFVFILVLATYVVVRREDWKRLNWLILLSLLLLAIIMLRPTAFPFLAALALFWLSQVTPSKRRIIVSFLLIVLGMVGLGAYAMGLFSQGEGLNIAHYLRYYIDNFRQGIVIRDRLAYSLPVQWDPGLTVSNLVLAISIFIHRIAAFWFITVKEFSLWHKVFNLFTLTPLFLFALVGYFRKKREVIRPAYITLFRYLIGVFVLFQAMTEVDYDFRYRVPVLPFVILFAGYGLTIIKPTKLFPRARLFELVRYISVGSLLALTDFVLFGVLNYLHVNIYLAALLDFVVGMIIGYLLHSRFTFRYDTTGKQIQKFSQLIVVGLGGLIITWLILYWVADGMGIHPALAKFIAMCLSFIWAYSMNRWWVFRRSSDSPIV